MIVIEKNTIGMGDRFAHEGEAQLRAVMAAVEQGVEVTPVWNKSKREHGIVGTEPASVQAEARAAVEALGWTGAWHVDADHINLSNVDPFLEASDFFTIDVAYAVGKPAEAPVREAFLTKHRDLVGELSVAGIEQPLAVTEEAMARAADHFLEAMREAGKTYRSLAERKGEDHLIIEVSVDETDTPQSPVDLLLILAMLADEGVPAQTIAPKFIGRFNKGVDYDGDLAGFERDFDAHLAVVAHAVEAFGLPASLKLSVHTGSDKFSLYPIINRLLRKHGAGVHVKTAGTTWLEEVIGLAEAGGDGLALAQEIYAGALARFDELAAPYATVVDIHPENLPAAETVRGWDSEAFTAALRHDASCPAYNPDFRQLLHVAFKVAAEMGPRFTEALVTHRESVARNVTANLLERHILPVFAQR